MRRRNMAARHLEEFQRVSRDVCDAQSWHESRKNPGDHPFTASRRDNMAWHTPAFEDIRFGFEVTMYINNR